MKIAIVDDNADVAEVMKLLFESDGCSEVEVFDCPLEALRIIDETYCAVVSDFDMPHMTGIEFLNRVLEGHPAIRCAILSAAPRAVQEISTSYPIFQKGNYSDLKAIRQWVRNLSTTQ